MPSLGLASKCIMFLMYDCTSHFVSDFCHALLWSIALLSPFPLTLLTFLPLPTSTECLFILPVHKTQKQQYCSSPVIPKWLQWQQASHVVDYLPHLFISCSSPPLPPPPIYQCTCLHVSGLFSFWVQQTSFPQTVLHFSQDWGQMNQFISRLHHFGICSVICLFRQFPRNSAS